MDVEKLPYNEGTRFINREKRIAVTFYPRQKTFRFPAGEYENSMNPAYALDIAKLLIIAHTEMFKAQKDPDQDQIADAPVPPG